MSQSDFWFAMTHLTYWRVGEIVADLPPRIHMILAHGTIESYVKLPLLCERDYGMTFALSSIKYFP